MENKTLRDIAVRYGTPTFVFDTESLKNRVRKIGEIFGAKIHLTYSIKANPFLIPAMLEVCEKLEVCSPGELVICKSLKVPGERIIYSGVSKTPTDIEEAIRLGAGIYTAESQRQLQLLQETAVSIDAQDRLPVLLRLNAGSQFGMSEKDLLELIENREQFTKIDIVGIHYFVGTQRKNKELKKQQNELLMLKEFFERIRTEYGIPLTRLEYGPGLPVPLFEGDDFSDTLAPAKMLAPYLQEVTDWCELTVEMGRFFTTECGCYLSRVMDTKSVEDKNYCIIDGGINHVNYLGQLMGMKVPVLECFPAAADSGVQEAHPAQEWAICGSLCTTNDMLVRAVTMPAPRIGDLFVFRNLGAYSVTEGIYLFLSRAMPGIVLYNNESDICQVREITETSPLNTIRL